MDGWMCTLENGIWFRILFHISWDAGMLQVVGKFFRISTIPYLTNWRHPLRCGKFELENSLEKSPMLRVCNVRYCTSSMARCVWFWCKANFCYDLLFSSVVSWLHCLTKPFLAFLYLLSFPLYDLLTLTQVPQSTSWEGKLLVSPSPTDSICVCPIPLFTNSEWLPKRITKFRKREAITLRNYVSHNCIYILTKVQHS